MAPIALLTIPGRRELSSQVFFLALYSFGLTLMGPVKRFETVTVIKGCMNTIDMTLTWISLCSAQPNNHSNDRGTKNLCCVCCPLDEKADQWLCDHLGHSHLLWGWHARGCGHPQTHCAIWIQGKVENHFTVLILPIALKCERFRFWFGKHT